MGKIREIPLGGNTTDLIRTMFSANPMGYQMINLQLNKYYSTRDGKLQKIVDVCSDKHVVNPFMSDNKVDYFPDGKVNLVNESADDLIREISHIGILMEIICESGLGFNIGHTSASKLDVVVAEDAESAFDLTGKYVCVGCEINELFDILLSVYLEYNRMYKS